MTFKVEVDATFVFTDGQTTLRAGDMAIDLNKIDSLEEWRVILYGMAAQSLASIAAFKQSTPQPTAQQGPVANSEVMTKIGEQFRQQQDQLASRTAQLQDQLKKQYEQLKGVYESSTSAGRGQPGVQPGPNS